MNETEQQQQQQQYEDNIRANRKLRHALQDRFALTQDLIERSRQPRPVSSKSRPETAVTTWTNRTGIAVSKVTNTDGVSTIAKQRRARRLKEREQHDLVQKENDVEHCRLLRVKIRSTQAHLDKIKARRDDLRRINLSLLHTIKTHEETSMSNIDSLLRKYGQYSTSTAAIAERFKTALADAQRDLDAADVHLADKLQALHDQVLDSQARVNKATADLRALLAYRERGQLALRRTVFDLQEQKVQQRQRHHLEKEALQEELKVLREGMHRSWKEQVESVHSQHSEGIVSSLSPSTRAALLQNIQMQEDIERHTQQQQLLKESIRTLEAKAVLLKSRLKHNSGSLIPETSKPLHPSTRAIPISTPPNMTPNSDVVPYAEQRHQLLQQHLQNEQHQHQHQLQLQQQRQRQQKQHPSPRAHGTDPQEAPLPLLEYLSKQRDAQDTGEGDVPTPKRIGQTQHQPPASLTSSSLENHSAHNSDHSHRKGTEVEVEVEVDDPLAHWLNGAFYGSQHHRDMIDSHQRSKTRDTAVHSVAAFVPSLSNWHNNNI